jgi:hypothetical protein
MREHKRRIRRLARRHPSNRVKGTNPSQYQVPTPSTSVDRSRPGEGIANLTACLRDAAPKPSVSRLCHGVELRVSSLRNTSRTRALLLSSPDLPTGLRLGRRERDGCLHAELGVTAAAVVREEVEQLCHSVEPRHVRSVANRWQRQTQPARPRARLRCPIPLPGVPRAALRRCMREAGRIEWLTPFARHATTQL